MRLSRLHLLVMFGALALMPTATMMASPSPTAYTVETVKALMAHPTKYLNKNIEVKNVVVAWVDPKASAGKSLWTVDDANNDAATCLGVYLGGGVGEKVLQKETIKGQFVLYTNVSGTKEYDLDPAAKSDVTKGGSATTTPTCY